LCYHASLGALDTIKDMKKHGKDVNMVDYDGRSCLHIAVCYGHKDLVAWLLNLPDCNPHPIGL
jgi:ankyrin repeat protein